MVRGRVYSEVSPTTRLLRMSWQLVQDRVRRANEHRERQGAPHPVEGLLFKSYRRIVKNGDKYYGDFFPGFLFTQ